MIRATRARNWRETGNDNFFMLFIPMGLVRPLLRDRDFDTPVQRAAL
jgi:hypothetical protein